MAAAGAIPHSAKKSKPSGARARAAVSGAALFAGLTFGLPLANAADSAAVARGAYLAAASGCDQCHTDSEHSGQPYAGGRKLAAGAFGVLVTPNITPDRDTGIGRWTATDFARAMRWGIAPDD